jgi:hypothetical protein
MQCLSEIAALENIREAFQEFSDVDCRAMQIKEAFRKDTDRNNATGQDWPHQQATFLDVVDHVNLSSLFR